MSLSEGQAAAAHEQESTRAARSWRRFVPYAGMLIIFAVIFWRIPIGEVAAALEHIPIGKFVGLFLPFSIAYWLIDSYCLTWVVRRFNAQMRLRDILPIRASMYLPALINTNLGQGGVAWYVSQKATIRFIEALSSILFIALLEIYQLFLFSTAGVILYHPRTAGQREIVSVLRVAYLIAWAALAGIIVLFEMARRRERIRERFDRGRFGAIGRTFLEARPRDYGIVIGIKAPAFLLSIVTQYLALSLYGIAIPFAKLTLFLPLVFLAAALPVAVAHLGTSQAAWLLFFSGNAPSARILAYSLAAHVTFMFCNGLIGLCFLPRAIRELSGVESTAREQNYGCR